MYFQIIFLYFILKDIHAHFDNNFIVDYFLHKQVSSVVGYSCNLIKDDLYLIKKFSEKGLTATLAKMTNKSDIRVFAKTFYWKVGVIIDTRCYSAENVASTFLDGTNYRMYGDLRDWLVLGNDLEDVIKVVDDQAFGFSTNFMIAVANGGQASYALYDVYNIYKFRGGLLNVTHYGDWHLKYGLSVTLLQNRLVRRSNFHGVLLKAMFFHSPTRSHNVSLLDYYRYNMDLSKDARSKFGYRILRHLGELYNFTFECFETTNWTAGDPLGPLARSLMNFEVDITGSPINLNTKRIYLMKFIHQVWLFRTCFIFRNPQPTSVKVQEILRPFENSIWYLICISMLVFIFILSSTLNDNDSDQSNIIKIISSFTVILGALCQQATTVEFPRLSTRIVFLCLMMFSLITYNYYSALVVSARLEEPIYKINNSLVEFGKIHLKMASEEMIYMEYFFNAPYWETKVFYNDYWLKVPESKRWMEPEKGMRLVQKGGFAYHVHPEVGYLTVAKLFNNRKICELMEVNLQHPTVTSFGVTNSSTFEDLMRVGLTKISEVGLRFRQANRWQHKKPDCRKDVLSASSIKIYEFSPHLVLLMIGIIVSIFLAITELISFHWNIESEPAKFEEMKKFTFGRNIV